MKIEVSEKHVKLRLAITIAAFLIAVVAFTIGVLSIGKKTPGYQNIQAAADAEAITAGKAVGYKYYFEGKSNDIKRSVKALEEVYTPILNNSYKKLDAKNTYATQVSIGSINQNLGKTVSISPELYAVLKDAYARTLEGNGYNMFAGDLYSEWRAIQILEEPKDFDPYFNKDQANRISDIAKMVSDLGNFSLEFLDDSSCSVRFSVSEAYKAFCAEYEIESNALDLNVLKDAYMLQMMASTLVAEGYSLGYLYTPEGLVLNTSPRGSLGYEMYTLEKTNEVVYATLDIPGEFQATTFTAFSMGSDYGYSIDADGGRLYRHLFFDPRTGEFSDVIMSATVICQGADIDNIVEVVYQSLILNTIDTEKRVSDYASKLEKEGMMVSYTLQSANV